MSPIAFLCPQNAPKSLAAGAPHQTPLVRFKGAYFVVFTKGSGRKRRERGGAPN